MEELTQTLVEVQSALVSLDPSRITAAEMQLQDCATTLRRTLSGGVAPEGAEEFLQRASELQALATRAAALQAGWIQVFASVTSGYTATGEPALPKLGHTLAKG